MAVEYNAAFGDLAFGDLAFGDLAFGDLAYTSVTRITAVVREQGAQGTPLPTTV
jgi:hypothetical protein